MLIGLVTKNGILIVEFANQKREQGMEKVHAVMEAAAQRLRPDTDDQPGYLAGRTAYCIEPWRRFYEPDSIGYCGGRRYFVLLDSYLVCNSCSLYFLIQRA